MPNSFAETPDGTLMVADGFGPVLKWDGFAFAAVAAGVPAPSSAPVLSEFGGPGTIVGNYSAFVRFLDARGLVSDLSPAAVAVQIGDGSGLVTGATSAAPIVVTSAAHGLNTGATVKVEDVLGLDNANGLFAVTVIDADHFSLDGSDADGSTYAGGGSWASGVAAVRYDDLPTSFDPRVVRRQVLRNTDGQFTTFYVDLDLTDLVSTTAASFNTDDTLLAATAVPLFDATGKDIANVHAEPPQNKCYLAHQLGRMFYAGEVEYAEGAAAVTFGSAAVAGVGTEWLDCVVGRYLYAVGGDTAYLIAAVDVDAQTLRLAVPYQGNTNPYAAYAIRPAQVEGRLVYYSEAGLPESVPAVNSIQLPDDGDQVTGLLAYSSFLYIVERHHIYRFTFQDDPAKDGGLYPNAARGCVNHRCWAIVQDTAFMLDEDGIHRFAKGQTDDGSISTPIQTLFRGDGRGYKINWNASRFFHCVHDPSVETIRWFVALSGCYLPRHAICYHYTLQRWWLEEYATPVGCSTLGKLGRLASTQTWGVGRQQVFLGGQHRKVWALAQGELDGPDDASGPVGGTVASATWRSLTGPAAFADDVVGCPVSIIAGRGKGQTRLVTSKSAATLRLKSPWLTLPDASSKFLVGAIPYSFQTGWFRWVDAEDANVRRVELMYEPVQSDQAVTVRRFRDRTATAVVSRITRNDDGVQLTAGSGDMDVSLTRSSGFVQFRLDGSRELQTHGPRLISISLTGFAGLETAKFYQITIDGVTQ